MSETSQLLSGVVVDTPNFLLGPGNPALAPAGSVRLPTLTPGARYPPTLPAGDILDSRPSAAPTTVPDVVNLDDDDDTSAPVRTDSGKRISRRQSIRNPPTLNLAGASTSFLDTSRASSAGPAQGERNLNRNSRATLPFGQFRAEVRKGWEALENCRSGNQADEEENSSPSITPNTSRARQDLTRQEPRRLLQGIGTPRQLLFVLRRARFAV
jgi:hypothetical protein